MFLATDKIELITRERGEARRLLFWNTRGAGRRGMWPEATPELTFKLRQDLNTPPRLDVSNAHTSRVLLDPNKELRQQFRWGRTARTEGVLRSGERWSGLLFYPASYEPTRRYRLVIQSVYGSAASEEFTLYGQQNGAGLGPTLFASYPGHVLAARDMFVLHLNVIDAPYDEPREAQVRQEAFEAVVAEFAEKGLIDPARVGLIGFSRNGYYVEYTLTHSNVPFAAAVTADNLGPELCTADADRIARRECARQR